MIAHINVNSGPSKHSPWFDDLKYQVALIISLDKLFGHAGGQVYQVGSYSPLFNDVLPYFEMDFKPIIVDYFKFFMIQVCEQRNSLVTFIAINTKDRFVKLSHLDLLNNKIITNR